MNFERAGEYIYHVDTCEIVTMSCITDIHRYFRHAGYRAHTLPSTYIYIYIETHHHHVPNEGIAHAAITPAQAGAQPETEIGIAKHAEVRDPPPQVPRQEGVVQVRLHPRRRGVVPATIGPGELGPHDLQRIASTGRGVVVPVQIDVQDVQVGVDFSLCDMRALGATKRKRRRACDELHE